MARKRIVDKSASRRTGETSRPVEPPAVKLTVRINARADQMLGIEAAMTRRSRSQLVEALILEHLGHWRVQRLSGKGEGDGVNGEHLGDVIATVVEPAGEVKTTGPNKAGGR
jgi:hypothetical protein